MSSIKFSNIYTGIHLAEEEFKPGASNERWEDYLALFNDLYLDKINERIKHNRWGVIFKQFQVSPSKFWVDIFPDNDTDWDIIFNIINSLPPRDIILEIQHPYWKFKDYLSQSGQTL